MKVLLVDDEEELVTTLAERLSFRGVEAQWTTTGHDAVALTEKEPFDVVVLDVKMPHLNGIQLKKKLEPWLAALSVSVRATVSALALLQPSTFSINSPLTLRKSLPSAIP